MIVCKFGGSATANKKSVENIKKLKNDERVVWVFSAIGKSNKDDKKLTDLLISYTNQKADKVKIKQQIILKFKKLCSYTNIDIDITKTINEQCKKFEDTGDKDMFISRGEYITSQIMAKYLGLKFIPAEQVIFLKNNKIDFPKTEKTIKKLILTYKNIVVPGFYALNQTEEANNKKSSIKLFSRGGSDYSACILAKCLSANVCENWTDIDGIYPINPNIKKSNVLKDLSYLDLNTMAKMDATVIHKDCAKLLNGCGTILQVRNIFNLNNAGTIVSSTCRQSAEFLSYAKEKNHCILVQGLKNGGNLKLTIPITDFQKGIDFLQKSKNQL